jgi:hypothetical protein
MMLLFLVEENCLCFYYDFRETNIDLGLDVYRSIQSLSIGGEYVIRGGAFGDCTIRRVQYEISNGLCIVGDRVFRVMDNGDVDFERQIFVCHSLIFASGDDCFSKNVYVKMGESFNLREYLVDRYCEVRVLDWYEEERYYISDIRMDVWTLKTGAFE